MGCTAPFRLGIAHRGIRSCVVGPSCSSLYTALGSPSVMPRHAV